MLTENGQVIALFVVGAVSQGAALITSVVSILRSVQVARARPAIAEELNQRYQARRKQLLVPLDQAENWANREGQTGGWQRVRVAKDRVEEQVRSEFSQEFDRHGMVPSTYENAGNQHYAESVWQMKSTLRPQVYSAGLLVVGIAFETWASVWALYLRA